MMKEKNIGLKDYGDEAPTLRDFLVVIIAVAVLIALDWIAYFKMGWFH
jgi:hypothetical protein